MKYTVEFVKNDDVITMELYGSPEDKFQTASMIIEILEQMTLYSIENAGFVFKTPNEELEIDVEVTEDEDNSLNIKLEGIDFNSDYNSISTVIIGMHNTLELLHQKGLEVDSLFKDVATMS